jgi:chorismate dehydratase
MDWNSGRIRIGAVGYLNSKPLIEGLACAGAELELDVPSRLAGRLALGQLDVALIPSIESISDPEYEIVSDACVAARGPVLSVKLYFRRPPAEVRSLALDAGSRTSAALARIMLAERFGVHPSTEPLPLDANVGSTSADAVLLIGDRAILPPRESFVATWDLGEEWFTWTGLPFVFALWVTRRKVLLGGVETALVAARDRGLQRLEAIAAREAQSMSLPLPVVNRYLRKHLHFRFGSAEQQGLKLFLSLAARQGLAPPGRTVAIRPPRPLAVNAEDAAQPAAAPVVAHGASMRPQLASVR